MRYIDCSVVNEYVNGAGVVAGAQGTKEAVSLRLTFSDEWAGLTKYVVFRDALGENPAVADLIVPESGNVYTAAIPASAFAEKGLMAVTVAGYDAETTLTTETVYFRVLEGDFALLGDDSVDNTQYDQIMQTFTAFEQNMLDAVEARRQAEAWAVGTIDGAAVDENAEQYENNAKYYAEQMAGIIADLDRAEGEYF